MTDRDRLAELLAVVYVDKSKRANVRIKVLKEREKVDRKTI